MVTIAELEQRVSDNRRAGARLLSTEETLAVLALLKAVLTECEFDVEPSVAAALDVFEALP